MDVGTLTWVLGGVFSLLFAAGKYILNKHDEKLKEHDQQIKEKMTLEASRQSEERILHMIGKMESSNKEEIAELRKEHKEEISAIRARQDKEVDGLRMEMHKMNEDFKENIKDLRDQVKNTEHRIISILEGMIKK